MSEKSREQLLAEILENFIIAVEKAKMEAVSRINIDVYRLDQSGLNVGRIPAYPPRDE
jgi:hypothetical protein